MTVPDRRLLAICQRWLNGSGEDTTMQVQELLERLRVMVNTLSASGLLDFAVTPTFNGSAPLVNPLASNLLFTPDNTLDIGALGATRARDLFLARHALISGLLKTGTGPVTLTDATGKIIGLTAAILASLDGSALTALTAANLTGGPIPAMSGVNLTALNAANLASGIAPSARLRTFVDTTSVGTQNNFNPGIVGDTTIRLSNASLLTITGFPAGVDGQIIHLINAAGNRVDLVHNSGSSSAGNKLANIAGSGNTSLMGSGSAIYQYDVTTAFWRLIHHEQGAWITPTFAAGDFTGSGFTWTVGAGDVTVMAYALRGRTLHVIFDLGTTSTSAAGRPCNIGNGQWGGFTIAKGTLLIGGYNSDGGPCGIDTQASSSTIKVYPTIGFATNWAGPQADALRMCSELFFEVT